MLHYDDDSVSPWGPLINHHHFTGVPVPAVQAKAMLVQGGISLRVGHPDLDLVVAFPPATGEVEPDNDADTEQQEPSYSEKSCSHGLHRSDFAENQIDAVAPAKVRARPPKMSKEQSIVAAGFFESVR